MYVLQSITFQILKQTSTIMMTKYMSNFLMLYIKNPRTYHGDPVKLM